MKIRKKELQAQLDYLYGELDTLWDAVIELQDKEEALHVEQAEAAKED